MRVNISGVIEYAGRLIATVDVEMMGKPYRTLMYRSSGRNVDGKGMWFPTSGINPSNGHIGKDAILAFPEGKNIYPTAITTEAQHRVPEKRLAAFDHHPLPFSFMELSGAVSAEYSKRPLQPMMRIPGNASAETLHMASSFLNMSLDSIRNSPELIKTLDADLLADDDMTVRAMPMP